MTNSQSIITRRQIRGLLRGSNHMHPGGALETFGLANKIGLSSSDVLFDAGTGLGAPIIELTQKYGCVSCGVDLNQDQVDIVNKEIIEKGLENKITVKQGELLVIPFKDNQFTKLMSFCVFGFIKNKEKLFNELYRVSKNKALLGLHVYYRKTNDSPKKTNAGLEFVPTLEEYKDLIANSPWQLISHKDISNIYKQDYNDMIQKENVLADEIAKKFGENALSEYRASFNHTRQLVLDDLWGGVEIVLQS